MYLQNIHNFRTVAILGIVGAHSLHNFDWSENILVFNSFDTLFNESSIWFFFIAGFLFQYLSKNYDTKHYYVTKIKNVIIPYLILSIPAIIASLTFVVQEMPVGFEGKSVIEKIFLFLITGKHLAPFWFVPTISIIYLFAPLLIAADKVKWPYYALPALLFMSALLGRDGFLEITRLGGYFSSISKAIYLFPVYFAGMFCSQYRDAVGRKVAVWHWPILLAAMIAFLGQVNYPQAVIQYIFVFKVITSVLLVHYLNQYGKIALSKISYVGTASFGIFFIHGYFLAATKIILERLSGSAVLHANILLLFGYIVAMTAISCLILWIAQKLLGERSRMVVGV